MKTLGFPEVSTSVQTYPGLQLSSFYEKVSNVLLQGIVRDVLKFVEKLKIDNSSRYVMFLFKKLLSP